MNAGQGPKAMRSETNMELTLRHVAQWSAGGTCHTVHAIDFLGLVGVMVYAIDRDEREREGWLDLGETET